MTTTATGLPVRVPGTSTDATGRTPAEYDAWLLARTWFDRSADLVAEFYRVYPSLRFLFEEPRPTRAQQLHRDYTRKRRHW